MPICDGPLTRFEEPSNEPGWPLTRLEGPNVLSRDAFTESDFHLGGTDTQGYRISGLYGLTTNLWLRARWLSATEIDGPPLSIDSLQVDLNARF